MGAPRLRAITAAALCTLFGAMLLPNLFRLLLPLPEWLYEVLLLTYLGGGLLVVLAVAVMAWVALWPATPYLHLRPGDPEPPGADPREARAALLAFPARVAMAGVATGELLTASGWLALMFAGMPGSLVLSLALTTATVVALLWMVLHALGQRAVEPLLSRLREVPLSRPSESGTGIARRMATMLMLVVLSGVVPVAIFANAYVERTQDGQESAHAERCAGWLAIATRGLTPEAAQQLVDTIDLSQGQPTPAPQEALQPRPRSLRAPARPPSALWGRAMNTSYTEAEQPALVVLPGGKRVFVPRHDSREALDSRPLALALTLSGLLGLCALLAYLLARAVAGDVRALVRRVQALSTLRPSELTSVRARSQVVAGRDAVARFHETEQLSEGLERLLDRVRRLHVESYLSIERTMDARRAKSQFLASMSHDLRGPLTSVLGFSELLTGGFEGEIPEAARRRLVHVHKTGRRLLRLLSEILDTAKVESQTIELHPRRCAPVELLMQAVAEARRGRLQEDIPLVVDVPTGLPAISVDPLRFPQALAHLINHVLDSIAPEQPGQPARPGPASAASPIPAPSTATPRSPSGTLRVLADRERASAALVDRERASAAVVDRERASAAVVDRERASAAVVDRERASAAVADRERASAAVVDRERASAAVVDREGRGPGAGALAPNREARPRAKASPSAQSQPAVPGQLGVVRISAREGEWRVTQVGQLARPVPTNDTDSGTFVRLRRGLPTQALQLAREAVLDRDGLAGASVSDSGTFPSSPAAMLAPPADARGTGAQAVTDPSQPSPPVVTTTIPTIEVLVEHVLAGAPEPPPAPPSAAPPTAAPPQSDARHSPSPAVPMSSTILLGAVGLGLALPLARRLIALHGGVIEVCAGASLGLRAVIPLRPPTLQLPQTDEAPKPPPPRPPASS